MKQIATTRAIIKDGNKVLLIRRHIDDSHGLSGRYELPGGTIESNEQPEDALKRELMEEIGVEAQVMQLKDVFCMMRSKQATDDTQYITAVYDVTLAPHTRKIELSHEHDKYVWKRLSDIQYDTITEMTQFIINVTQPSGTTDETLLSAHQNVASDTTNATVIVYSDGGSRGNPGPSAAGYVVMDTHESVIADGGKYLGITTNNQAEYQAICMGLEKARELGATHVDFRMDSLLAVNQLNGIYQIKNRELWPVHARIKELSKEFRSVTYRHVRREFNTLADSMVNKILNEQAPSKA